MPHTKIFWKLAALAAMALLADLQLSNAQNVNLSTASVRVASMGTNTLNLGLNDEAAGKQYLAKFSGAMTISGEGVTELDGKILSLDYYDKDDLKSVSIAKTELKDRKIMITTTDGVGYVISDLQSSLRGRIKPAAAPPPPAKKASTPGATKK